MKRLTALIWFAVAALLAGAVLAAPQLVWHDGTNFYTGTNSVIVTMRGTNYYYYLDTTNWTALWMDADAYYVGRMSNGVVNVKTNSLMP